MYSAWYYYKGRVIFLFFRIVAPFIALVFCFLFLLTGMLSASLYSYVAICCHCICGFPSPCPAQLTRVFTPELSHPIVNHTNNSLWERTRSLLFHSNPKGTDLERVFYPGGKKVMKYLWCSNKPSYLPSFSRYSFYSFEFVFLVEIFFLIQSFA